MKLHKKLGRLFTEGPKLGSCTDDWGLWLSNTFPTHEGPHPPAHVKMSPILKGFLYSRFEKVMKKILQQAWKCSKHEGVKSLRFENFQAKRQRRKCAIGWTCNMTKRRHSLWEKFRVGDYFILAKYLWSRNGAVFWECDTEYIFSRALFQNLHNFNQDATGSSTEFEGPTFLRY